MNFEKVILTTLESGSVKLTNLDEAVFPLNSTLAFFTLKRNALNKLKKFSFKNILKNKRNKARDVKAKGLMSREILRAKAGTSSGKKDEATSYKLTKEQLEILSQINEKYGNEIIEAVISFRNNILAPYQLIKRLVKSNKTVTSKEKFGMTHSQFTASVNSGLNKISKRGNVFFEKWNENQAIFNELGEAILSLKELKQSFISTGKLRESIINRVLKFYNLGSEEFEDTLEDLRKTYDELRKNNNLIAATKLQPEKIEADPIYYQNIIKRNIDLRKGIIKKERESANAKTEPLLKEETDITDTESFKKNNKFNASLGKYMLRRNVINELRVENNNNFKKTYISIIDKMIEQALERRSEVLVKNNKIKSGIEFNDIERKIFKVKPNIKLQYSNNPNDYIFLVIDSDFTDPEYIERPENLIKAEERIESEIKKFERFLQKELDPEDYNKLKKYRLINNLISVSELEEPDKLFKTPEELKAMKKKEIIPNETIPVDNDNEEEEKKYSEFDITPDDKL